jgi:hypothetical protein
MSNNQQSQILSSSPSTPSQLQPPQNPLIAMTQISAAPMSVASAGTIISITATTVANSKDNMGELSKSSTVTTTSTSTTNTTAPAAVVQVQPVAITTTVASSTVGDTGKVTFNEPTSKVELKTPTKQQSNDKNKPIPMEVDGPKKDGKFKNYD